MMITHQSYSCFLVFWFSFLFISLTLFAYPPGMTTSIGWIVDQLDLLASLVALVNVATLDEEPDTSPTAETAKTR